MTAEPRKARRLGNGAGAGGGQSDGDERRWDWECVDDDTPRKADDMEP